MFGEFWEGSFRARCRVRASGQVRPFGCQLKWSLERRLLPGSCRSCAGRPRRVLGLTCQCFFLVAAVHGRQLSQTLDDWCVNPNIEITASRTDRITDSKPAAACQAHDQGID